VAGVGGGTPKLLGSAPEPYTRKRETAEAFWNTLENYFFINGDLFTDESKRVSSALTYFKIGTPASDWAQDRQKTALTATPIAFGTWNDFKSAFKSQFIPEYTKLEATNAMHTSKMGLRPFDEWYLEWSTYATRSGANGDTKMFAFRKAIPQALHQKIIGISPQPTTLVGLVEKAKEFNRVYRLYSNPAFTGYSASGRGPRARALATDDTQVQAFTTSCPPKRGKITKEEKDRWFKNNLCFYCGNAGHISRDCHIKKTQGAMGSNTQGKPRQSTDVKVCVAITHEDQYEDTTDDHAAQVVAIYYEPPPRFSIPRPHSAPVNEDF
jgi:hypothetical protein